MQNKKSNFFFLNSYHFFAKYEKRGKLWRNIFMWLEVLSTLYVVYLKKLKLSINIRKWKVKISLLSHSLYKFYFNKFYFNILWWFFLFTQKIRKAKIREFWFSLFCKSLNQLKTISCYFIYRRNIKNIKRQIFYKKSFFSQKIRLLTQKKKKFCLLKNNYHINYNGNYNECNIINKKKLK